MYRLNYIVAGPHPNEQTRDEVEAGRIADPNNHKCSVIFSHLAGKAQREAYECVRQDIRQGVWHLTEENEPRCRPSRFSDLSHGHITIQNSLVDVSLADSSSVDGIGYTCAAGVGGGLDSRGASWSKKGRGWFGGRRDFFQNLCRAKISRLENLCCARQQLHHGVRA